jgi:hypothetical protein
MFNDKNLLAKSGLTSTEAERDWLTTCLAEYCCEGSGTALMRNKNIKDVPTVYQGIEIAKNSHILPVWDSSIKSDGYE